MQGASRATRTQEELVEGHLALAHRVARRYAGRGEPVDDLVQVASLGLIRASKRFDPRRGVAFATFATQVMEGEIRRHLRLLRSSPVPEAEAADDLADPHDVSDESSNRMLLSRSARVLNERDRQIVFLRFHADMTERQIGASLGISQAQVSRRLERALARLRADLGDPPESADITPATVIPATARAKKAHEAVERDTTMSSVAARRSKHSAESPPPDTDAAPTYSGRFLVRMPSELHAGLAQAAQRENVSLNRFVTDALAATAGGAAHEERQPDLEEPRRLGGVRLVLAANVVLLALTVAVAIVLIVLALQRGI